MRIQTISSALRISALRRNAVSLKTVVLAVQTLILIFCYCSVFAQVHTNHKATLTIDGKQLYSSSIQFSRQGDTTRRLTAYFDHTQRLVRAETTLFREKPLALYSNIIDDYRNGEHIRLTASGNSYTIQRRKKSDAALEEKTMTAENAIVGALLGERVAQAVPQIIRGEEVQFPLAIPYLGISTTMKLVKTGTETIKGKGCIIAKLEASNFLLRAVVGEASYFAFEQSKPYRLIRYTGLLGIPSPEGSQQSGIADTHY
ncbi:MAG: hypothetical protein MUF71_15275 [Candidatus Kapabacteria bacterium]|jgi:hypothetical protein|nr:hypothetical protein [Candidatus Kapabacteria bacterium]